MNNPKNYTYVIYLMWNIERWYILVAPCARLHYRVHLTRCCNCCNKITRFHLPNRCFSHGQTRQEIWWEVRRRSSPLIAFRLIVREILLLQSVLNRSAYLATRVFRYYNFASTTQFSLRTLRKRNSAFVVSHLYSFIKIRTDSFRILMTETFVELIIIIS